MLILLTKPFHSFNPRVLAGGRDAEISLFSASQAVSIHASSREDATKEAQNDRKAYGFNPRVLAGGRDQ